MAAYSSRKKSSIMKKMNQKALLHIDHAIKAFGGYIRHPKPDPDDKENPIIPREVDDLAFEFEEDICSYFLEQHDVAKLKLFLSGPAFATIPGAPQPSPIEIVWEVIVRRNHGDPLPGPKFTITFGNACRPPSSDSIMTLNDEQGRLVHMCVMVSRNRHRQAHEPEREDALHNLRIFNSSVLKVLQRAYNYSTAGGKVIPLPQDKHIDKDFWLRRKSATGIPT